MNEKANIQNLTQQLASKHGLSKDEAESFVREFFSLVSDALDKDQMVKVKGLGTFRVIDVDDRDSVDVNTGERITISGHKKVTFTPDASLKEEVNKPFADFETTILEDDPQEEVLVDADREDDHLSTIHELYGRPVVAPEPEQAVIEVAPKEEPEADEVENIEDVQPVETDTEVQEEELQKASGPETEAPEEVIESSTAQEETLVEENLGVQDNDKTDVEQSSDVLPEPEPQEEAVVGPESEAGVQLLYGSTEKEAPEVGTVEEDAPIEEDKPAESPKLETSKRSHRHHGHRRHHEKESNTALKWASIIFLLIIMGIGAFVLNMYYPGIFREAGSNSYDEPVAQEAPASQVPEVQEPVADAIPEKPVSSEAVKSETQIKTESVKVDAGAPKEASPSSVASQPAQTAVTQPASTATTQKLTEGKNYVIDGTLTTHVIKSGETLRIISEKYYGSRSFSTKIVEHNKSVIKNPDNVPAGTKISIPRLVEK